MQRHGEAQGPCIRTSAMLNVPQAVFTRWNFNLCFTNSPQSRVHVFSLINGSIDLIKNAFFLGHNNPVIIHSYAFHYAQYETHLAQSLIKPFKGDQHCIIFDTQRLERRWVYTRNLIGHVGPAAEVSGFLTVLGPLIMISQRQAAPGRYQCIISGLVQALNHTRHRNPLVSVTSSQTQEPRSQSAIWIFCSLSFHYPSRSFSPTIP